VFYLLGPRPIAGFLGRKMKKKMKKQGSGCLLGTKKEMGVGKLNKKSIC